MLSLLRLNLRDYRFRYTAAFPLVVTITDPEALSGSGLELSFALEGNVRNNHVLNSSAATVTLSSGQSVLDLSAQEQLVDHMYTVKVLDRRTNRPLSDARVVFGCGNEFMMGNTGVDGTWQGKLPYCVGGAVVADADEYVRASANVTNINDDRGATSLELSVWPIVTKQVRVFKITAADAAAYGQTRTRLTKNDSLTLQMLRMKESDFEMDLPLVPALQFGGTSLGDALLANFADTVNELDAALAAQQITQAERDAILAEIETAKKEDLGENLAVVVENMTVALAPGRYEMQGLLMYNGNITIPAKRVTIIPLILYRTIEAQNLPSWQSGGVLLLGENATVLRPEDVYGPKNLTVFVLEQKLPTSWEDLEAYQDIAEYQRYDRRALVQPKWE
jgi:hypothetical protein